LHVVATPGKPAKQLVRDVQSVAMASFGVDVDRNVVSVVQLEEDLDEAPDEHPRHDGQPAAEAAGGRRRTLLTGMTLQSSAGQLSVSVALRHAGRDARGTSGPPAAVQGMPRLTAVATLDALAQLHPDALSADLAGVEVRQLGVGRVAVVTVAERLSRADGVLVGTAAVRAAGESDAVARAVLDAVNRRLPE
jgi:hypothetical protein